ncbi:MAG: GIY-YIG nuclease family protein [Ignavibacteriae bacterium]|nr:GIY-YIG nuclease family protein [Ignavibacteriota bacterium]
MPYFTYIIKSKIKDRYYIGSCEDLTIRLNRHNSGGSISTKAYIPWEIVYYEEYTSKSEALKREFALKRIKNKDILRKIINKEI